jgi:hypothetical protein
VFIYFSPTKITLFTLLANNVNEFNSIQRHDALYKNVGINAKLSVTQYICSFGGTGYIFRIKYNKLSLKIRSAFVLTALFHATHCWRLLTSRLQAFVNELALLEFRIAHTYTRCCKIEEAICVYLSGTPRSGRLHGH